MISKDATHHGYPVCVWMRPEVLRKRPLFLPGTHKVKPAVNVENPKKAQYVGMFARKQAPYFGLVEKVLHLEHEWSDKIREK